MLSVNSSPLLRSLSSFCSFLLDGGGAGGLSGVSGTLADSGASLGPAIVPSSSCISPSGSGDRGGGRVSMFSPAVSGRGRLLSSSFSSSIKLLFGGVGGVLGGLVGLVSGGEGFTAFTGDVGVFDDSELLRLIL